LRADPDRITPHARAGSPQEPQEPQEPESVHQQRGIRRDQGIAKSGNPRARRTAIELAWLWLRHQPGSALARWFHERVAGAKGRMRRIILVAMARKLIVSLWRYVTCGTVPEGAVLKA
jgi:transposase